MLLDKLKVAQFESGGTVMTSEIETTPLASSPPSSGNSPEFVSR